MKKVTKKSWRNDAIAKVTGQAKFASDYFLVDMLHAVPVYSDNIHAEIISIDTQEALKQEGIISVLTAEDIPGLKQTGQIIKDLPLLAYKKIRYNGEPVALIIAQNRENALKASGLIKVNAKILPANFDIEKSLDKDTVLIHDERKSNLIGHHQIRRGDSNYYPAQDTFHFSETFHTPKIEHFYLEPEAAVCIPRADGVFEVLGSMQHPFSTRRFISAYMGIPLNKIEVKTVSVGGGFGGKDDTSALVCARAVLASYYTKKPVKIVYDREWSVKESYKRHAYRIKYDMFVSKDAKIEAVKCDILADGGAYASVSDWVTWRSTVQCCGPYKVANVYCDTNSVYTNSVFTGAFRGFGSPQINFAIEQMIEIAAKKLNVCEIEFRKRNMLRQGDTTITGQVLEGHKVSLEEALDRILAESNYFDKREKCSYGDKALDEWYGIGLAMSYRGMSLGAEGKDFCSAVINVQFDGSVLLEVAIHENGQGSETAMIDLLFKELGISRDKIVYRMSSTANIPDGGTTVASRGTLMGGGALINAVENLKSIFRENLTDILGEGDYRFENNLISSRDKSLSFDEAVTHLFLKQTYPYSFGTFKAPKVSWDEETGQGNAYFTWVYGCQIIELKVSNTGKSKGKITLLNAFAAHDVGRVINEGMLLGQFFGGMVMGMGYALKEEVIEENGKIQNLNYKPSLIMRANDIPEMNAIFIENPDSLSPSKAKGIGEPTLELMAPAIANALYRATGKRFYSLPMQKELLKYLNEGDND